MTVLQRLAIFQSFKQHEGLMQRMNGISEPTPQEESTPAATPQPQIQQSASYADILSTIGAQLKERQGLIAKRVAFISLPLILTAVPLISLNEISKGIAIPKELQGWIFFILLGLMLFVGLPWAIVTGQIFKIERNIWIDSFFDEKQLSSKQSWALAKKLFWPSIVVNILVFLRYWVIPIILSIGAPVTYLLSALQKTIAFNGPVFIGLLIGIVALLIIYTYFINIHLRYLLFLLVDNYKTQAFSYRSLFHEMNHLNRASKTKDFTKMLVTLLGTEATAGAANAAIGGLNGFITSTMSGAGKAVGQAASMYANEVVTINKSYAQTVTFYIYYRAARELTYGQAQAINSTLYSQAEPSKIS